MIAIVHVVSLAWMLQPSLAPTLAVARPKPLPSQAECQSYQGSATGNNDPTQLFELRVCPGPKGVEATLQSSSLVSGHSLRASEGSWDAGGTTLTLVETRFIDSRPEPGWRFCLIDELKLTKRASGNLEGTYLSRDCSDRADLVLRPLAAGQGTSEQGPANASQPEPPREPETPREPARVEPPPPPPASPDDSRPGGCTCTSASSPTSLPLGLLALASLVLLRGRRRARTRRSPLVTTENGGPVAPGSRSA